jgi:hypothetical protein
MITILSPTDVKLHMNELQITIAITHLYSDNVMLHKMALETVTNDGGEKSHQSIVYYPSLHEH